ncbi:hypothetical protein SUDANB66_00297 [Streptomyces sp. SudanB66_2053]
MTGHTRRQDRERRVRLSGYPGAAPARGAGRAEASGRSGAREVRHVTERERAARRTGDAG